MKTNLSRKKKKKGKRRKGRAEDKKRKKNIKTHLFSEQTQHKINTAYKCFNIIMLVKNIPE